jgi:ketosteroid isomerase-like protein
MRAITTVGLDIAKSVFQVHGVDAAGKVIIRRQLKRRQVLPFFQRLPACELLADDASWTITGNSLASKTYGSRDAFISEVIRPLNARMSVGLKPTIRNIYAEGDTVIVFFDASGTARDGLPYENTYAWFLDIRDGKVTKASAFFDSVAFNDFWQRVSPAADQ